MKKYFWLILLSLPCLLHAESQNWNQVVAQASNSIVSIRVNAVRPFDTEGSKVTQATGFVVDAKKGIILTNRHVVQPGPVTAQAIFANSEEVSLVPIYRDPVHDFGFFKYSPKALKFIQPEALKLDETLATVGQEIRVIGNDSGEQMSILSGTLARLDRSAPFYGVGRYNDFNTFYYQSAADTSGGSSGAPVISSSGKVIALNAGGNNGSSSSFFLPLYKVTRALASIQKSEPIWRGTIQSTLSYKTFDEVRRLGLTSELEKQFRESNGGRGMLTVLKTVRAGPSDGLLLPGDIIISLSSTTQNQLFINRYEKFEIFLDQHVGKTVSLRIFRQNQELDIDLLVQDLHSITPDEYLQVSDSVLNKFSYQLARQTNLSTDGIYISNPGYMFANAGLGRGVVMKTINGIAVNALLDAQQAFFQLEQGEYFSVKYVTIGNPNVERIANVKFQTKWHLNRQCKRNDDSGIWSCHSIDFNQKVNTPKAAEVNFKKHSSKVVSKAARSLVLVKAALPYHIDGQNFSNYSGTGLVVDAERGLVIADRNTVPVKMAEVTITFAGIAELPVKVLSINPLHSFALLQYDTRLLKDSNVRSASFSNKKLAGGDSVWLVGYQTGNRLISEKLTVSSNDPLVLPTPRVPQFKQVNTNAVTINSPPKVASGILIDKSGKIRSWWTNFSGGRAGTQTYDRGLPIRQILKMKDQWLKNGSIEWHSLDVELSALSVANARNYGLSDSWMSRFQSESELTQVLQVSKRVAGTDAFDKLKDGDLLLAIDGNLVSDFSDIDRAVTNRPVQLSLWREGSEITIALKASRLSSEDTEVAYLWAGALLQSPHRAIAAQHGVEQSGVYISWFWYGSPANRFGLRPLNRITEIEGEKVNDLSQFIALTQRHSDKDYLRIRLVDLIGRESIITLKPDEHYWPTQVIKYEQGQWVNRSL